MTTFKDDLDFLTQSFVAHSDTIKMANLFNKMAGVMRDYAYSNTSNRLERILDINDNYSVLKEVAIINVTTINEWAVENSNTKQAQSILKEVVDSTIRLMDIFEKFEKIMIAFNDSENINSSYFTSEISTLWRCSDNIREIVAQCYDSFGYVYEEMLKLSE